MKNRSVSVTGATGFVGWHAAESFARDGWAVRAIVREKVEHAIHWCETEGLAGIWIAKLVHERIDVFHENSAAQRSIRFP